MNKRDSMNEPGASVNFGISFFCKIIALFASQNQISRAPGRRDTFVLLPRQCVSVWVFNCRHGVWGRFCCSRVCSFEGWPVTTRTGLLCKQTETDGVHSHQAGR